MLNKPQKFEFKKNVTNVLTKDSTHEHPVKSFGLSVFQSNDSFENHTNQ
jgi:hypothetical protein